MWTMHRNIRVTVCILTVSVHSSEYSESLKSFIFLYWSSKVYPARIYLFNVNKGNTTTLCEICS